MALESRADENLICYSNWVATMASASATNSRRLPCRKRRRRLSCCQRALARASRPADHTRVWLSGRACSSTSSTRDFRWPATHFASLAASRFRADFLQAFPFAIYRRRKEEEYLQFFYVKARAARAHDSHLSRFFTKLSYDALHVSHRFARFKLAMLLFLLLFSSIAL